MPPFINKKQEHKAREQGPLGPVTNGIKIIRNIRSWEKAKPNWSESHFHNQARHTATMSCGTSMTPHHLESQHPLLRSGYTWLKKHLKLLAQVPLRSLTLLFFVSLHLHIIQPARKVECEAGKKAHCWSAGLLRGSLGIHTRSKSKPGAVLDQESFAVAYTAVIWLVVQQRSWTYKREKHFFATSRLCLVDRAELARPCRKLEVPAALSGRTMFPCAFLSEVDCSWVSKHVCDLHKGCAWCKH